MISIYAIIVFSGTWIILETVIYSCVPDDIEAVSSEFDREVDSHYYSMKEKFETIAELLDQSD